MTSPAAIPAAHYRPDIDGLRAVAVLSVVLTHLGIFIRGGYVGVDVFFVISGYLITRLIRKDLEAGTFSLAGFWERRVRRIFPALAAVALLTAAAGWWLLLPEAYRSFADSLRSLGLLSSNFYFWQDQDYFSPAARHKPLLHTWSLAVEEQFYLVVPLLLMGLMRGGKSRSAAAWVVGLGAVSLALSVALLGREPQAVFYLLPGRAWELFAGLLLALTEGRWVPAASPGLDLTSVLGLGLILGSAGAYSDGTPFPGLAALPPVCGAALLLWAGSGTGPLPLANRWLAARPMVSVGLWSYSIYLWHWPLLVFWRAVNLNPPGPAEKGGLVVLSLALGYASWRWIETPFRQRRLLRHRPALVGFACATLLVMLVSGSLIRHFDGIPERLTPEVRDIAKTSERNMRYMVRLKAADVPGKLRRFGRTPAHAEVLVWGDSHAMSLLPGLDAAGRDQDMAVIAATRPGTIAVLGDYHKDPTDQAFCTAVAHYIQESKVRAVLLAGRWSTHRTPAFGSGLIATVAMLRDRGVHVLVVNDVPEFPWPVPNALAVVTVLRRSPAELAVSRTDYDDANRHYLRLLPRLRELGVEILDPLEVLPADSRGGLLPYDAEGSLYYDSNHLSTHGSLVLKPLFDRALRRIAATSPRD